METKGDKGKWKERRKVEEREEIRKKIKRTHTGNVCSDTNKQRIPSYILTKSILNELHLLSLDCFQTGRRKSGYKCNE